jgi:D-inositol-3-phosphate glycosyltransferase
MFPGSPTDYGAACAALIRDYSREHTAGYHLVHSHYWLSGSVGRRLCSAWDIPHLVTFHTRARAKLAACAGHREPRIRLDTEDELVGGCDRVIASTAREAGELAEQAHDGAARIRVVGCGVDLERFHPHAQPGQRSNRRSRKRSRLLFVGRFDPMKNIVLLLDSLAHLDAAVNVLFLGGGGGDTAEGERLLSMARERSVEDRVELGGSVPNEQIPAYYQEADAVVVSSSYESFGLVVLEALACGTPVVSTPVGVAPRVIRDGFNGYLADPGDPARFAEAIERTLELSRTSDPAAVRATVEEFGWSRVARSLLHVYNEL